MIEGSKPGVGWAADGYLGLGPGIMALCFVVGHSIRVIVLIRKHARLSSSHLINSRADHAGEKDRRQ